jgi:glycosyltransferase involved in cell wall biosynthesis
LLRAAAGVADVRWAVMVVGGGPDRGRLEAEAATLGIAERVRFTGTLERVADHVAAMDLFAMTSGSRESFGNSLVEAMALGVPSAVFADSPGPREHVTDGETGFVLTGEADLAEAIRRVAGDPEAAARMGRAGAADVRARYSLEAMLRAYAGLYERARARADSP